ncbi:MAG TPA: PQQ-binding-like beta-propeller repeat protein [Ktedonobacterales bacterium]|jgi:outer membrane protein assembly factor BamB|nr:PQQ-binding-like beta-propeller repeat protein [Ktedonobacterales bacterium]
MRSEIRQRNKRAWMQGIGLFGLLSVLVSITVFNMPAAHAQRPTDWTTYQYNNQRTGFNKLENIITPSSAASLKPKWTVSAGGSVSTQPVTTNGVVYWGSWDGYEHASNSSTGAGIWMTNVGQTTNGNCYPPTVGAASTATVTIKGKSTLTIFVGGGNSTFYALDAASGGILWQISLGASSAGNFLWGSPAVFNGSVYIGMASFGDCPLVQGKMYQLNASTGAIQHVFNTVPDGCVGGGVWGSPAIDASGRLYFATGNPGGGCSTPTPYAQAVVELNASNLSYVASWQVPASQAIGDGDFGSTPTIFNSMLGIVNKNGIYYAFQRNQLAAGPVWQTQVADPGESPEGGQGSISPSAWDGTNLYVAGGSVTINGVSCTGSLRALNPSSGAIIWSQCLTGGPVLGPVTAVPGLAIVGAGQDLVVVNSSSGQRVFTYTQPVGNWFVAPSVSNGALYVGVMGSYGGYSGGELYAFTPNGQ